MFEIEKVVVPKKRNRKDNLRESHVELFKSRGFRDTARSRCVHDHKGNEFRTVKEMCDFWGVKYYTFRYRMSKKVTLELALTLPVT